MKVEGRERNAFGVAVWPWFIWVLLLNSAILNAADLAANDAFQGANKLYYEGNFTDAAAAYEKISVSAPSSSAVYFNLGNAWFKSGKIGQAVAAYRRAERLAPRDADIRANLQFVRNQVQGPSFALNPVQRWLAILTLNEWTILAGLAVWLLFSFLAALEWRPVWKSNSRWFLIGLALLTLVIGAGFAAAFQLNRSVLIAVVIRNDVAVRQGPLEESRNAFSVHDGAELRVLDRKDEWLQVTTDSRRIGWIHRDQVLELFNEAPKSIGARVAAQAAFRNP